MIRCLCFIQEGQVEAGVEARLAAGIGRIVRESELGAEPAIAWVVVPRGNGWTAGEPSSSAVVTLTTPLIDQALRIRMLTALCDLWVEQTGCEVNDVLATVMPAA
ncbi:MAG: hypothetical protein AAGI72_22055 [Pseudomonadota bacterium]